jgi:protein O-GlcNAc transferase
MQPPISQLQQIFARGFAAHRAGDIAAAERLYKEVLEADAEQFDALHMLGIIEGQRGDFSAGLRRIEQALRVRPDSVDALVNRGRMQIELGDEAGALVAFGKALALNSRSRRAHSGMSRALRRQRRFAQALAHCSTAIEIAPDYADAWSNRGGILFDLNRLDEALASYDRALAIKPDGAAAWFGRANALRFLARRDEAYAAFAKVYSLQPDFPYAEGERLHAKMYLCDWDGLEAECARLVAGVRQGARRSTPFTMLNVSPSLADQRRCAEVFAADLCPVAPPKLWRGERYRHDRIRLAYLSADFHNHATAYLAAGLFDAHDRAQFEITGVSFGPYAADDMHRRLRGAFHRFLDVRSQTDAEIANILHGLQIDIGVDLKGFTEHSRASIFAHRFAPIQLSYLGFPGTMGANYIDYIIADRTVIPADHAVFYAEKIAWLPDTYQANDAGRRIAPHAPTRDELGLPSAAFVFCCFNSCYKIEPTIFDLWMRLLRAADGAVLWLLHENETAKRNLRLEAQRRGVDPQRLVFASRLPLAEHLARHRHADLFLDTLRYNAHTTASDALWAGVPVLTCLGPSFAGRVAASLLRAVGLPDLVTESLEDYEALALRIATEPALCADLKTRLARNREKYPLFDTTRFARHIETAYRTMWQRYQQGEPPESFAVDAA